MEGIVDGFQNRYDEEKVVMVLDETCTDIEEQAEQYRRDLDEEVWIATSSWSKK